MPTPSDPTAIQPKTYEEMAKTAQDALDEQNRAVEECRAGVKHGHAVTIPHDTGSEYEAEAHLCVWWSLIARRLSCGIHCPRIDVALFVLALWKIGDIGAIGKCMRCGELFFRLRPSKKYCSDRCQAAAGMRRKRIRDKRQAQAKKRGQR